jgi:hypothetical protein
MEKEKKILCNKCGLEKDPSKFWFDKRRNQPRKPCITCSRKSEKLTDKILYENNVITKSDVENHYKGKGLPPNVLSFFTDTIILNRTIKKMEKPIVKAEGSSLFIFCPLCAEFKTIELPCAAESLTEIITLFTEIHNNHEISRIRN